LPQSSAAEITDSTNLPKITSTGFEVPSSFLTSSNIIYIAIRRGPMAVPTDATEVFDIAFDGALDNNEPYIRTSLSYVDAVINNSRSNPSNYHRLGSRLTQGSYLNTNSSSAETSDAFYKYDYQNGWYGTAASNSINTNGISWMWKRAPSFCDVVAYTGTGANRTVSHNLGVAPEMFWVKRRNSTGGSWGVYHKDVGNNKALVLDQTGASFNANWWNSTTPTDSLFYIGGDEATVNASGDNYIAYLFASLDGVSKVGSYTGDGNSTQTIDCGFTNGARFVIVKPSSYSDEWHVWDSERGIVASAADKRLELNTADAEDGADDHIDPHSTGFIIKSPFNTSGASYIFYAIA